MNRQDLLPMNPQTIVCPKEGCGASGRIGIHSPQERRYICHACKGTFAETTGTALYGLKYPVWVVVLVLSLLAYGCPLVAIEKAFQLDERTVRLWQERGARRPPSCKSMCWHRGIFP